MKTQTIDPELVNIYGKFGLYEGDGAICLRFTECGQRINVVMPMSFAVAVVKDLIRAIENIRPDLGYTVFPQ